MSGNKTIAAEWSASNMPALATSLTPVAPGVLISFFVSEFSENS